MRRIARGVLGFGLTAVIAAGAIVVFTEARAACRIAPECWANSDCDAICGVGQGRCAHNKCPVRICKCR